MVQLEPGFGLFFNVHVLAVSATSTYLRAVTDKHSGLANAFGIFQSHYQTSLLASYPPSSISWIGTTQGFLVNVTGLISGRLYDAGYARSLVYLGSVLNVAGLLSASFSTTYPQIFSSLGICVGLGSGTFYVPSLALVAVYFPARTRPLATGIAATGAGVGGVVYPILFRSLLTRFDLPWAIRSFALLNGVLLGVSCVLIRPPSFSVPPSPSLSTSDFPSDFPSTPESTSHPPSLSGAPTTTQPQVTHTPSPRKLIDTTALHSPSFILFSIALFLLWLGVDIPFFYLPLFSQQILSLSPSWGDFLLSILNASAIFGRISLGILAVWFGALYVWMGSIVFSSVVLVAWIGVVDLRGAVVFVVLYGALTGGVISLVSAALLVLSPDLTVLGTRLGMSGVLAGIGFLVGPPVAGAIQTAEGGGFKAQSGFAAGTYVAAFAVLVGAVVVNRGRERKGGLETDVGFSELESSRTALVEEGEKRV